MPSVIQIPESSMVPHSIPRTYIPLEYGNLDYRPPDLKQPPPGVNPFTRNISGHCLDTNGAPIEGATVALHRDSDNYRVGTTTTNAQGIYKFPRRFDDPHTYHTVAFTIAGGATQIHGTSDKGLVPS